MLQRLMFHLLESRHYWRTVSFSEMAELYASRMMRTLAISMVSVFIAVYLYQNGYSLPFIMLYFGSYFVLRAIVAFPFAFMVARIGPKHATLISNFLYVPALLGLVMVPQYGIWALIGSGVFQALSVTLYDIAYLVDFSKVKNDGDAGKEIGYMHIVEQIARGVSPLAGGLVAYWFGPQATLFFAAGVFTLAAFPLFFSPEPVRTHQVITFHGLPMKKLRRGFIAEFAAGMDFVASGILWSLFVAIVVFGTANNVVYAEIGLLSSLTIVAGVIGARLFGLLVDRHRGRELLNTGVAADSLTHLLRPFVATPLGVLMINIANEMSTTAYALPLTKALFAQADDLPGYRIAYMALLSFSAAAGAAAFCLVVAVISLYFDEIFSMQVGYLIATLGVYLIVLQQFPALAKRPQFRK